MINSIVETKCLVKIQNLIDDAECFRIIRELRWPGKIMTCVFCDSENIIKHGQHNTQPERRRYFCKACGCYFDDLTGTVFEKRHRPLRVWILCLYFTGLNLSDSQIAEELDLNESDVQNTATELREEITVKKPKVVLAGEVESDEVYIVAGHKGNPDAVEKKEREGRRNRLKGAGGRGTLQKEKPPVPGLIERGGDVVVRMLENVKQATIEPVVRETVKRGSVIYTDEYRIYDRLSEW